MKYRIIVYYFNPNGTNDIAIEGSESDGDPRCMDMMQEATFGIDVDRFKLTYYAGPDDSYSAYVPLKTVLKHIAVSPVSDGSETIKFLSKYFKSVKAVAS